jgi:hypothetical protein
MNTGRTDVDSRQYRFAFAIEALSQVPTDFVLPSDLGEFDAGVFLPRDDADWLGRRAYPPRILLLSRREAIVVPHPAAGEQPVRAPLDHMERIEWGRILLIGWIALAWDGGRIRLPYNTRARGPVEKCVRTLQHRWLPAASPHQTPSAEAFGAPLDLKFENALSAELLAGEAPLAQFFQPAARGLRRFRWLRRNHWMAGDLVSVTSRRLLWITERRQGKYERYGAVSHSARLSSITGIRCVGAGRGTRFEITLRSGDAWNVPLGADQAQEARRFEAAVQMLL